jgi:hypothetical protein
VSIWLVVALFIGGVIGRASMVRAVETHDREFNSNVRRLAFRIARAAHPKVKETNQ